MLAFNVISVIIITEKQQFLKLCSCKMSVKRYLLGRFNEKEIEPAIITKGKKIELFFKMIIHQ